MSGGIKPHISHNVSEETLIANGAFVGRREIGPEHVVRARSVVRTRSSIKSFGTTKMLNFCCTARLLLISEENCESCPVGLGLLSMIAAMVLLPRLQIILKRGVFMDVDLFIEKLAVKGYLSADEQIELKAKGTYKEKIDGTLSILCKKHPKKTYDNVLDALREMGRDDIIKELQQPT
ncbi:unnamed protein product, partial [Darwinula stevensoni]